jgi:hypothetical protein
MLGRILFFVVLLSNLIISAAPYKGNVADGDFYYRPNYIAEGVEYNELYTLDSFKEDLRVNSLKKKVTSVEEALRVLPSFVLAQYIVMYMSRSLQQASPEYPRIIAFSPRADFVLAFNGHPSQRGYDKLELMTFDYPTNKFSFHELSFNESRGYKFSEPNPSTCMRCHQSSSRIGENPRPNWEPYSTWPGAVGSTDGRFYTPLKNTQDYKNKFNNQDSLYISLQSKEGEIINAFLENKSQHPRYSILPKLSIEGEQVREPTNLSENLSFLNAKRVVQIVKDSPLYFNIKETFITFIKCSASNDSSFNVSPEAFQWLQLNKSFQEITYKPMKDYSTYYFENDGHVLMAPEQNKKEVLNFSEMIHLLFEPFGMDTTDWSLDFKSRGRFAFYERFGSPSNVMALYQKALESVIPESKNITCSKDFQKKSIEKIDALIEEFKFRPQHKEHELSDEIKIQKTVTTCMKCHDGNDVAPYLPFNNPHKLKDLLGQGGYPRGTLLEEVNYRLSDLAPIEDAMPANKVLNKEEVQNFIKYLESL